MESIGLEEKETAVLCSKIHATVLPLSDFCVSGHVKWKAVGLMSPS